MPQVQTELLRSHVFFLLLRYFFLHHALVLYQKVSCKVSLVHPTPSEYTTSSGSDAHRPSSVLLFLYLCYAYIIVAEIKRWYRSRCCHFYSSSKQCCFAYSIMLISRPNMKRPWKNQVNWKGWERV
jgi:hypothetical protein